MATAEKAMVGRLEDIKSLSAQIQSDANTILDSLYVNGDAYRTVKKIADMAEALANEINTVRLPGDGERICFTGISTRFNVGDKVYYIRKDSTVDSGIILRISEKNKKANRDKPPHQKEIKIIVTSSYGKSIGVEQDALISKSAYQNLCSRLNWNELVTKKLSDGKFIHLKQLQGFYYVWITKFIGEKCPPIISGITEGQINNEMLKTIQSA